jgi:hypothetical protein
MTKSTNLNPQAQSQELVRAAIEQTLQKLSTAFREHDASALSGIYAEDADWTNSFGTTRHGRDAIISYLRGLFADPHFAAGRQVGTPELALRFVTDDGPSPRRTWKFKDNKRSQVAYSQCEGITRSKY